MNHNLVGVRQVMSQLVMKITTNSEPCVTMMLEKLQKSGWFLVDSCHLSATYFQGPAMAAMGEWRDGLCCSKLTCSMPPKLNRQGEKSFFESIFVAIVYTCYIH